MKLLLVDFDGILGNFDRYLYRKSRPNHPALKNVPDTYMNKLLDYRCIEGFDFFKAFSEFPISWPGETDIIPGSREFLATARAAGVKIVILTSVPEKSGIYRLRQMVREGLYFDEAYFTMGHKKSEFVNTLLERHDPHTAVFIDDLAKNAIDVAENCAGVDVVTCDIPYNHATFETADPETLERMSIVCHVPEDMEATARAMHRRALACLGLSTLVQESIA